MVSEHGEPIFCEKGVSVNPHLLRWLPPARPHTPLLYGHGKQTELPAAWGSLERLRAPGDVEFVVERIGLSAPTASVGPGLRAKVPRDVDHPGNEHDECLA